MLGHHLANRRVSSPFIPHVIVYLHVSGQAAHPCCPTFRYVPIVELNSQPNLLTSAPRLQYQYVTCRSELIAFIDPCSNSGVVENVGVLL